MYLVEVSYDESETSQRCFNECPLLQAVSVGSEGGCSSSLVVWLLFPTHHTITRWEGASNMEAGDQLRTIKSLVP